MRVSRLALTDFRSWESLDLEFDEGVNVLVGANGQGKTNIVEAVGYVAALASHRVATDAPLVRSGAGQAVIRLQALRDDRSALVELEINPGRANRARINRSPVPRAREVLGLLRTTLFAPQDLALVQGDPSERRRFLDDLLVARQPRWAAVRSDYDRILKQRNALLKSAQGSRRANLDLRTLEAWNTHLAATGAELICGRLALVAAMAPHLSSAGAEIGGAGAELLAISYRSALGESLNATEDGAVSREAVAAALLIEMDSRGKDELDRGVSLVGPHRDDLTVSLGQLPVKGYASHGESWSAALSLRLASFELLRAEGSEPVLILDDVFAELDPGRRSRLAGRAATVEQVLITAAVAADVPTELVGARFEVRDGSVTRDR